jgi:hypothetical protein
VGSMVGNFIFLAKLHGVVVKESSVLDVILYNLAREKEKGGGGGRVVPILDSCSYIIRTSVTDTCTAYARTRHV